MFLNESLIRYLMRYALSQMSHICFLIFTDLPQSDTTEEEQEWRRSFCPDHPHIKQEEGEASSSEEMDTKFKLNPDCLMESNHEGRSPSSNHRRAELHPGSAPHQVKPHPAVAQTEEVNVGVKQEVDWRHTELCASKGELKEVMPDVKPENNLQQTCESRSMHFRSMYSRSVKFILFSSLCPVSLVCTHCVRDNLLIDGYLFVMVFLMVCTEC